tara:strand:+ start:848 stop:1309 length:462 start_codon:yes stop_codon:yes gene_type:complete
MSLFQNISNAESYGGSQNIRPGRHTLKIKECLTRESKKNKGTSFFIVELEVVNSQGGYPTSAVPGSESGRSVPHNKGDRVSWIVNLGLPSAMNNCKGFALAVGMPEDEIDEAAMEHIVSSDNPLAGETIQADANMILTRAGNDFTKINWSPAS